MAKAYKSAGSGYTVKCSEDELINTLVEMYTYHYKEVCDIDRTIDEDTEMIADLDAETAYALGKAQGAVDALSAVLLSVVGGGQMYDIWQNTMQWANNDEVEV